MQELTSVMLILQGVCILNLRLQTGSSEDWDGNKVKAREKSTSLIDFNDPKPQTSMEQTMDIDKVAFSKLQIGQSDLKEETLELTKSLIPHHQ